MRKERMKNLGFWVVTVMLGLFSFFCLSNSVYGHEDNRLREENQRLDEMESHYLREVKGVLCDNGYVNSGVTMTKITEIDGSREYTVLIHNDLIQYAGEDTIQQLYKELEAIEFEDENSTFFHDFSECNIPRNE